MIGTSIVWVVAMLSMGRLEPLPSSPWFQSADEGFEALPEIARLHREGITCEPKSILKFEFTYPAEPK
jgi:hypothetical protein